MIRRIDITGFLCFEHLFLELPETGLFLVCGVNKDINTNSSVGTGKTSLFHAIYYALFGTMPFKVSKENLNNWKLARDGLKWDMHIYLYDGVDIYRDMDGNFRLNAGGVLLTKRKSVIQNRIEAYLKMNAKQFYYSYFFSHEGSSFFSLYPSERVMLLTDLFDLKVFDRIQKLALTEHKKVSETVMKLEFDLAEMKGKYKQLREIVERAEKSKRGVSEYKKQRDSILSVYRNRIKSLKQQKQYIKETHEKILSLQEEYERRKQHLSALLNEEGMEARKEQLETALKKIEEDIYSTKRDIRDVQRQIKMYKAGYCPTCGRKFDRIEQSISSFEDKRKQLMLNLDKLEAQRDSVKKELDMVLDRIKQYDRMRHDLNMLLYRIDQLKNTYRQLQNDYSNQLSEVRQMKSRVRQLIAQLKQREMDDRSERDEVKSRIAKLVYGMREVSKQITKTSYLKEAYLYWSDKFRQVKYDYYGDIVKTLEQFINYYFTFFRSRIRIKIDLTEDGVDFRFFVDDMECDYSQLSSGQKQIVKISGFFALSNLMQYYCGVNHRVYFFDEPLVNLSSYERERFMEYLNSLRNTHQIFLVDHAVDIQGMGYDKVIVLERRHGKTNLAQ